MIGHEKDTRNDEEDEKDVPACLPIVVWFDQEHVFVFLLVAVTQALRYVDLLEELIVLFVVILLQVILGVPRLRIIG